MSRRTPLVALLALATSIAALGAAPAQASPRAPAAVRAAAVGAPPRSYVPPSRPFFSYPNRSAAEAMAIRDRVLHTIQSTWGGRRNPSGAAQRGNGTIRIATWSFKDWAIAKALVAARNRGVSVQVLAAKGANKDNGPWKWLRKHLGHRLYLTGRPSSRDRVSFARECPGSCRGRGGTAHAKYFLFQNVGPRHVPHVVFNTSMNLTRFAYKGQWNQAQVMKSRPIWADFMSVFRQARLARPTAHPYHVKSSGSVTDIFFPRPGASSSRDPVMQMFKKTICKGARSGGNRQGRTRVRIIQYAIYGDRGTWLAKGLRGLWSRGCDVKIIYSVSSRPVLRILRNHSGRGAIPMRQSVIRNSRGEITKYNHSKWMTITGRQYGSRSAWLTFTGSANWANLAFSSDEQMQRIRSRTQAGPYLSAFSKTWKQRTSKVPPFGRVAVNGRMVPLVDPTAPAGDVPFGQGIYKYMTED